MIAFLFVASAALITIIILGGWSRFEGAKAVPPIYVLAYLLFAFYVFRWNRGVLPVGSALAVVLIIFAAVAAPAWFSRDKAGFTDPAMPASLLGILTLLLIPLQALLIAFAMRGFRQGWNIEAGSRADIDARGAAAAAEPGPQTAA